MQRIKFEKTVVLFLQVPFGLRIPQTRTLFLRKGLLLAEIVPVADRFQQPGFNRTFLSANSLIKQRIRCIIHDRLFYFINIHTHRLSFQL